MNIEFGRFDFRVREHGSVLGREAEHTARSSDLLAIFEGLLGGEVDTPFPIADEPGRSLEMALAPDNGLEQDFTLGLETLPCGNDGSRP